MPPYTGQAGKMNATSGVSDIVGGRRPVVRRSGAVRNQLRLLRHAFVSPQKQAISMISWYEYLLRSIIIPTWVSALVLARWGRALAEPYQFRNAWPRRFEQGNIDH